MKLSKLSGSSYIFGFLFLSYLVIGSSVSLLLPYRGVIYDTAPSLVAILVGVSIIGYSKLHFFRKIEVRYFGTPINDKYRKHFYALGGGILTIGLFLILFDLFCGFSP